MSSTVKHGMHCSWLAGLIGTAPSQELLDIWNKREAALVEAGPEATTLGGVLHTRPLGEPCPQHPEQALLNVHALALALWYVHHVWYVCCDLNVGVHLVMWASPEMH